MMGVAFLCGGCSVFGFGGGVVGGWSAVFVIGFS